MAEEDSIDLNEAYKIARSIGFPSPKEWIENPSLREKWALPKDLMLQSIEEGKTPFRNVKSHRYFVRTKDGSVYECGSSLSKVTNILENEGATFDSWKDWLKKVEVKPEMREDTSGAIRIDVFFEIKAPKSALAI